MSYLVTGGWGYIGSRIVRDLLKAGENVTVFDKTAPQSFEHLPGELLERVAVVNGDVGDTIQFCSAVEEHRPRYIIHTAFGMETADYRSKKDQNTPANRAIGALLSEINISFALRVNCGGMLNVLEAARLFNVERVVYTSAVAAFGTGIGALHEAALGDEAVFAPDSIYGATKVLNEVMARVYRDRFGVDSIGFRLARAFGVGSPLPFTDFMHRVALEEDVDLPDPDYFNSYIHVDDCADAHIFACTAPRQRLGVFNLREGEYTNQELAAAIARVHPGAKIQIRPGKGPGINVPRMSADGIVDELGWRPKYTLDQGLLDVMNHSRAKAGLPLL